MFLPSWSKWWNKETIRWWYWVQIFQNKYMKQRVHKHPLVFYIHACKPKVVTMAVSTVMTTLRILPQTLLFSFSIFYKFGLILIVIQSVAKKSYWGLARKIWMHPRYASRLCIQIFHFVQQHVFTPLRSVLNDKTGNHSSNPELSSSSSSFVYSFSSI